MTLVQDGFNAGSASSLNSGIWNAGTSDAGGIGYSVSASGYAVTTQTSTNLAVAWSAPAGADQFAQRKLTNNSGGSTGVVVRCVKGTNAAATAGYLLRHNGTNLSIIKFNADGTSTTTLVGVAHTRVAGQVMRLTVAGDTLTGYIDGVAVSGLTITDSSYPSGGSVGVRDAGTTGVQFDDFAGGDLSEIANVSPGSTSDTGGGAPAPTTGEVVNLSPASGIPAFKGLVTLPSGRLLHKGKKLHELRADFWGAAGAYTPPAWLTVPSGTATLVAPTTSFGHLELSTAATLNAVASLAVTPTVSTLQHRAIRIDVEGMSFSIASPAAEWRLGVTDGSGTGGGIAQTDGAGAAFLYSGGESNRTTGVFSHLGANANQRRQTSLLILPQDKELYMLEDDEMLLWRDGAATWVDGTVTISLSIKATAATAATLRLASLTVTTYC